MQYLLVMTCPNVTFFVRTSRAFYVFVFTLWLWSVHCNIDFGCGLIFENCHFSIVEIMQNAVSIGDDVSKCHFFCQDKSGILCVCFYTMAVECALQYRLWVWVDF